jgi:tRNA-specific 2-thiouridylase
LYVTRLDPARNTVVVGDAREVEVDSLVADQVNWISIEDLAGPLDVLAQIRHRHSPARATIRPGERGVEVHFEAPQWAPAPGQSVVFYQGDMVVGGGVIGAGRAEAA